jgi:D-inositol-3-phosphate glycosyltransferase
VRLAMVGDIDLRDQLLDRPNRLVSLSEALSRSGHEVTIYTREYGHVAPSLDAASGCRIVRLPAGLGRFAGHLVDHWRMDPPNVVHAHSWGYAVAAQLAADQCGVPTVQSFCPHSFPRRAPSAVDRDRQRVESILVKKASWVAADCGQTMLAHIRLGARRARTSVIGRGVDVNTFDPPEPRKLDDNGRVVVIAPELSEHHGTDVALQSLRGVPAAELLVVGDGDTGRLRALASELGVGRRVEFAPMVSYTEWPTLLRGAGVVACIPCAEPADSLVLEAMAAGIPVIASAVGELVDIVVHEVTGLLIKPANAVDLARAMTTMYEDSFRRHGLGFAGRTRVASRYNWDRIAEDVLAIYRKVHTASGSPVVYGQARPHRLSVQ